MKGSYDEVCANMQANAEVKQKLLDYRKQIRKTLSNYSFDYNTSIICAVICQHATITVVYITCSLLWK